MANWNALLGAKGIEDVSVTDNTAVLASIPSEFLGTATGATRGRAKMQVRTAAILVSENTVAPTQSDESTGTKYNVGDIFYANGAGNMGKLKFAPATGTSASIHTTYQVKGN